MSKWTEYTCSDEQIAELFISRYIVRDTLKERKYIYSNTSFDNQIDLKNWLAEIRATAYWIIPDDPLREMKIRWAQTGQPVWTRRKIENEYFYWLPTTTPDWNIPNAEYSFIEFEKSVDK